MSLSGALSNALSGLTATSRAATVVSSNISNALTESYGRRSINLSSRATGSYGGVQIDSVSRHMNQFLLGDLRLAEGELAGADTLATYHQRIEDLLGTPEDAGSLTDVVARFESSLISAISRPDLTERLSGVLTAAQDLAGAFNDVSDGIQTIREEADTEIDAAVSRINDLLLQAETLNSDIARTLNTGGDAAALMDHLQSVVDELSGYIPVTQVPRDNGTVALVSPGGAILLDGRAAQLSFVRTNVIAPHMTLENGLLSGLTLNGNDIRTGSEGGPIAGGRLGALFEIRDSQATEIQGMVDSAARDLIERFQDAGIDPTRASGDAGLFTDLGLVFDPADEPGIAGRIGINALVDPASGGATWRLRDGLGATGPGSAGDSLLLQDMLDAMDETRTPSLPAFGTAGLSTTSIAATVLSLAATGRNAAEQHLSFSATRQEELKSRLLAEGVDTDQEMQRLLLIEQAYAANAKVVQTVDEMINALLRI